MPKQATRTYSRITRYAATLLGKQIRIARKERKMTAQELAERAGISRGLHISLLQVDRKSVV